MGCYCLGRPLCRTLARNAVSLSIIETEEFAASGRRPGSSRCHHRDDGISFRAGRLRTASATRTIANSDPVVRTNGDTRFRGRFRRDGGARFSAELCGRQCRNGDQTIASRAVWILLFALLITVPLWIKLAAHEVTDVWQWVFGTYSVLLFYTIALALLPTWFHWLAPKPELRAAISGVALWAAGTAGYYLWPQRPFSALEFVRMLLVSGNYAYLQMMGTAILAMPIGLHLRRARDAGVDRMFLGRLLIGGLVLSGIGILWGITTGEYDMRRIVEGKLSVPPRPWYFLHFGALALVAIAGFDLLTRSVAWLVRPGYVLALFGQTSLVIFTAHSFVLPSLELLGHYVPLHGIVRVAMAFVPFTLFCTWVIYQRHRRSTQKLATRRVSEQPSELVLASS